MRDRSMVLAMPLHGSYFLIHLQRLGLFKKGSRSQGFQGSSGNALKNKRVEIRPVILLNKY
jgi:hypothetical protein